MALITGYKPGFVTRLLTIVNLRWVQTNPLVFGINGKIY